jgi:eukaryotic-like serine/threonine-protein kinase
MMVRASTAAGRGARFASLSADEAVRGTVVDAMSRDLLVAVLAVITDAIPRRVLSDAVAEWARDRRQGLAQVLLRRGSIDEERLRALLCLAESHLDRHRGDLHTCLDSWHALGVTEDVLTAIDDGGLKATVRSTAGLDSTLPADSRAGRGDETIGGEAGGDETIAMGGGDSNGTEGAPAAAGAERFRPIRLHAKGGIGQVWVARDGELQREVALKVIQDRFAERPDQRARFVLEAEITGNLEHPGIVPVYSLGRDAEGRPYYAMRFIRGQSLAAAIRQFHLRWHGKGAEAAGRGAMWGVEFRQLLGRFLDVCDAIDYAHSRGVLHRDLKPANIMLGRYGETLVVDWGLAKVIDRPDIVPAMAEGDAEPSLSATGARSIAGETQPGTMIGTPSYMSPEQARGAVDEMGTVSDVYSLGATLYEILTGQVAFSGEKTADVLRRVVAGEFRPPRAVLRSIPAPLEAICLKAMALGRRDRYDTVRELAVDLQHWLADEPVAAHPEGRLARMGRWLRRHRTWTFAAVAGLLGIAVAATIGIVVVERGRQREAEARALAETNYNLARGAVEDYLTGVSEDTLLKEQDSLDIRRLRAKLLNTALDYYRNFLRQRSGDPKLRGELADAQFHVGQILREIGTPDRSIEAYNSSIALWEELLAAAPGDPDVRMHLARASLALGEQYAEVRNFRPAFDALKRSRSILIGLQSEGRTDPTTRVTLAECNKELGIAEGEAGELDHGLEHLAEAEMILRELIGSSPDDVGYRTLLAYTINARGFIYSNKGMDAEALSAFRAFQEIGRGLLGEDRSGPRPAPLLDMMALSYFNLATMFYRQKQPPATILESFEKALEYRLALAEAHPSVNDYREKLAVNLVEVSRFRHEFGRTEQAIDAARKSIEILDDLIASQPDRPRYRAELAKALNFLGYFLDERRDNTGALPVFRRALLEQERLVQSSPENDVYKDYEVTILENLGEQSADLGRAEEGLPHFRRAVEVRRELLGRHPGDRKSTLDLADQFATMAKFQRHGGDSAAAEQSYAGAVAALEPLAEGDAEVQLRRGTFRMGQGRAAADRGMDAEALVSLDRAVEILTPLGAAAGVDPRPRQRLTEALWETARILRRSGRIDRADLLDAERRALWEGRPPGELVALAIEETTEAATVGYGDGGGDRIAAVRRLDLDLAAENLRMAVALGFREPAALLRARDAALLLSRPDVPRLEDIGFPEDPIVPAPGSH